MTPPSWDVSELLTKNVKSFDGSDMPTRVKLKAERDLSNKDLLHVRQIIVNNNEGKVE
jgi:hypothetical protein